MRNPISRHFLAALLGLYVLSTIPFATPGQAQTLDDAAARFRQQRNTIAGRRDLPAYANAGPAPAAPVDVDQAVRLAQLKARWAREQTRDLPSPRVTDPSRIYLPGVLENAAIPVLEENIAPVELLADQAVRDELSLLATTATVFLTGDTYVDEANPTTDYDQEERMILGVDPGGKSRRLYINGNMPTLPPGMTAANITNSTLRLYQYNDLNGGSYRMRIFPTDDPWDVSSVRWSSQPGRDATPFDSPLVSAGMGHKNFDLTELVRSWYAGGTPTYPRGITLIMSDENERGGSYTTTDCVSAFCSAGTTLAEARPVWTVEFGPPIASRGELRVSESLSFAPNNHPPRGSDVTARFSVSNTSGREVSVPRLRVSMRGPSGTIYNFPSTPSLTLAPGQSYTYQQTRSLPEAGRYTGEAQFYNGASWYKIYIAPGSGLANSRQYVMRDLPPRKGARTQGPNGKNGKAGEPVNTSTGNFVATVVDATLPDLGLSLAFGRTFNSLDVDTIGSFGPGWAATYDEQLIRRDDDSVIYRQGTGQQTYFAPGFREEYVPNDIDGEIILVPDGSYVAEDGFDLTLARDLASGVWMLTDADFTTTTFDGNGRWQTITDRYGATLTASYTGAELASVRSANASCAFSWANGRVTAIACPTGTLRYTYDGANRLQSATDLTGATITYGYDDLNRLTRIVDGDGRLVVENVYDVANRVVMQREGITNWTTFNYDTGTRVSTYVDANGRTLTDTYDDRDRLVQRVDALGHAERSTYDADDRLLSYTNQLGATWSYTYDERGNLLTETDPLNATWSYTYNERNQRLSATDPLGHTTRFSYDGDLLQSKQDALASQEFYYSTPDGLVFAELDALGRVIRRTYTASGQIASETTPGGATTRYAYNAAGDQTSVIDALGQRTAYAYDAQHRLTRIDHADGSVERMAYDRLGNLISQTNRLGATRQLFYDGNNRLIGETDFAGAVTEYFYDGVGNRVRVVDALNQTTTFGYDALGQLITITDRLGATSTYTYDPAGRLLTETDPLGCVIAHEYDATGRETRTIDARGNGVSRTYDALGRTKTETDRLGATTSFSYDALGRLRSRTDALGRVTRYEYDAVGNQLAVIDPLGKLSRIEYDADNRPVVQIDRTGAVSRSTYDALGRLTAASDPRGATTSTAYDALDRPVRVTDALGNRVATTYDAEGRRLREIDARGFSRSWTYDADGRQRTATDRTGATATTEYDALGRPMRVIDALGGVQTTQYDAEGRVIAQTNALGQTTRTAYDAVGNPIRITDSRGFVTTIEYDANNNVVRTIDALGNVAQVVYNAADQPVQEIDALGNSHTTQYDLLGREIATRDPHGAATTTAYDALDRVARTTDPRGATTTLEYDAEGRVLREIDALKRVTSTSYDAAGAPLIITNAKGQRTATQYDLLGRVIKITDALGNVTVTSYDATGNVAKLVDPRGATTTYQYDGEGREIARTDALGHSWRTEYDALGRTVRSLDPLGNTTTTAYDAIGNPTRIVTPGGQTTRMIYDAASNLIAQTDARGFVTTTAYDALNRPIATTNPRGITTRRQYDRAGNLIATIDGKGQTTRMAYDKAQRLTGVTDALGQTVQIRYDPAGAPIETLDGNGHRRRTEYDLLGRETARIDALGQRTTISYDAADNPIVEQRPNGARITTAYDALDRPVTVTLSSGETQTTSYDRAGNVIARTAADGQQQLTYDLLGRQIGYIDSAGQRVSWHYNAAGQHTATIYPDGRAVTLGYDANGWPTEIMDRLGNPIRATYDADGRLLDLAYPASAQRWAYDSAGELTAVLNEGNNGAFAAYEYTLDANDNRTHERVSAVTLGGLITLEETAYSYDAADRLVRSQRSGPTSTALDQRYSYDAAGNRTAVNATEAGVNWTQQLRYDAADRLLALTDSRSGTTTLSYDAAGQRLGVATSQGQQRYSYDALGRLTRIALLDAAGTPTTTQTAVYDALNRRIVVEDRAADGALLASERTLYDGDEWNVLGQLTGATQTWLVNQPQGLDHLAVESGGSARFAHSDGLGSYIAYTDGRGAVLGGTPARYGDWGDVESGAANLTGGYNYTGQRQAASGLLYARNRFYDPLTATWLTPDPFPAEQTAPGSLNRYSYVRNNPITRTDPLGLFDWSSGTVQSGDTLREIAADAGTTVQALLDLNPQITSPDRIYAGQQLSIEIRSAASHAQQQRDSSVARGSNGARCAARCDAFYTVRRGDTLGEIAAKFQVPWKWIASANRGPVGTNRNVHAGEMLYIPCSDPGRGAIAGAHGDRQLQSVKATASANRQRVRRPTNSVFLKFESAIGARISHEQKFGRVFRIPLIKYSFGASGEVSVEFSVTGGTQGRDSCLKVEATGAVQANEIRLPGPFKTNVWGKLQGELSACAHGGTTGNISISGGAKIYVSASLAKKVKAEAGIEGSLSYDIIRKDLGWKARVYAFAEVKLWKIHKKLLDVSVSFSGKKRL